MSLLDDIKALKTVDALPLDLGCGVTVYVKSFKIAEYNKFIASFKDKDVRDLNVDIVIASTFDADGNRVFHDDDHDIVNNLQAGIVNRIVDAFNDVNGLNDSKVCEAEKK